MMKITIIGLGAMGSIYAALFAAAGYEVIAYDPGLSILMRSIKRDFQLKAQAEPIQSKI